MLSLEIEGKITGLLLIQRDRPVNGCALREQKVKTTNSKREKRSGSLSFQKWWHWAVLADDYAAEFSYF